MFGEVHRKGFSLLGQNGENTELELDFRFIEWESKQYGFYGRAVDQFVGHYNGLCVIYPVYRPNFIVRNLKSLNS